MMNAARRIEPLIRYAMAAGSQTMPDGTVVDQSEGDVDLVLSEDGVMINTGMIRQ